MTWTWCSTPLRSVVEKQETRSPEKEEREAASHESRLASRGLTVAWVVCLSYDRAMSVLCPRYVHPRRTCRGSGRDRSRDDRVPPRQRRHEPEVGNGRPHPRRPLDPAQQLRHALPRPGRRDGGRRIRTSRPPPGPLAGAVPPARAPPL